MKEFLENIDPVSFVTGVGFAYVCGILVSIENLISTRVDLNYWMIRLTRAKLGIKEPKPLWVRIKDRFCKK